jgi:hypothetical protein
VQVVCQSRTSKLVTGAAVSTSTRKLSLEQLAAAAAVVMDTPPDALRQPHTSGGAQTTLKPRVELVRTMSHSNLRPEGRSTQPLHVNTSETMSAALISGGHSSSFTSLDSPKPGAQRVDNLRLDEGAAVRSSTAASGSLDAHSTAQPSSSAGPRCSINGAGTEGWDEEATWHASGHEVWPPGTCCDACT